MTMLHALYQNQPTPSAPPSLLGEIINPQYLNARLSAMSSYNTPVDKARALLGTLGIRFRSSNTPATSTQATRYSIPIWTAYQHSTNIAYTSPAGYTVGVPPVQFA